MKLALPLALVAACLAGCSASTSDSSADELTDFRVCGAEAFDAAEAECSEDESASPLRSGRFYCSARLGDGHEGERFHGRFRYAGKPFPESGRSIPEHADNAWITIYTGGRELPAGRWSCEIDVGEATASKAFTSGGPSARVLDLASCATEATSQAGPAKVCTPGGAATAIPATGSVTCSATFVGAQGKVGRLDLLYHGKPTQVSFTRKLPLPVTAFGVQITQPSGNLRPGPYTCVFTLDGEPVARRAFTIGG